MWYVTRVRLRRKSATLELCEDFVSAGAMRECFAPEYEVMWHTRGQWKPVRQLLFPGYLFFVTDDVELLADELRDVPAPTRLLGDDENSFSPVTDSEHNWLFAFFDSEHVVRMSEGVIEGDVVKVTRGPLMGMEGQIRKIDRHKRRAYLDVSLFGRTVPTNVGLEIVRKTTAGGTREAAGQLLGGGHEHVRGL